MFDRKAFPWRTSEEAVGEVPPAHETRLELEKDLGLAEGMLEAQRDKVGALTKHFSDKAARSKILSKYLDGAEDSDGELAQLCCHCRLPVGDVRYGGVDGRASLMHGECMAQHLVHEISMEDKARTKKDASQKR